MGFLVQAASSLQPTELEEILGISPTLAESLNELADDPTPHAAFEVSLNLLMYDLEGSARLNNPAGSFLHLLCSKKKDLDDLGHALVAFVYFLRLVALEEVRKRREKKEKVEEVWTYVRTE